MLEGQPICQVKVCTSWLLLLMLVSLLGLSACQPKEADLPFETIDQADWGNAGHAYEAQEPTLIVIAQPVDVAGLDDWIALDAQTQLQTLDYDTHFALIVFQGWKPTTGYSVQVDCITRRGDTVTVYAQFREPRPEEEKAPEVTSPYHLVQVQEVGAWGRDITFNLVVDEAVITSLSHYVP